MSAPWAARPRGGLGVSPEPYEEGGIDKRAEELSVCTSQEKGNDEEAKRLDLVVEDLAGK